MIIIGQISLFINFLAVPWGMGDLSYLTGIAPVFLALETWSLKHWTSREVAYMDFPLLLEGQHPSPHVV